jgi:D-lactate dehydrogenase
VLKIIDRKIAKGMKMKNIKKAKIIFFDTKEYDREFFNAANEKYRFNIKYLNERLTVDTVSLTRGFDVVCAFVNDNLRQEVARVLIKNKIELIALRCAGYNNVDFKTLYKKIHVVRVPAYSPHAVAEHTIAMILALNRKIHRAYYRTRDSNFDISGFIGFDMYRKTAGIIGTGKIGRIVSEILHGFGMRVLVYDLYPDPGWADRIGAEYVKLDSLYKESDIISLHCPLTPENVHMINSASISAMKDGVMIINTGRGALINTKDLIEKLKSKKVGYAGLDVYEEEEKYFFEDFSSKGVDDDILSRLLTFPNVLITSHQAFFTREALRNIAETTLANIKAFYNNEILENEICYQCSNKECKKEKLGRCFVSSCERGRALHIPRRAKALKSAACK